MFMTPNWIVEAANVLKDFRPGRLPRFVNLLFDFFTLQVTEERFGYRVVPAITPSAHAGCNSCSACGYYLIKPTPQPLSIDLDCCTGKQR
jgi:hypothetical protein